MSDLITKTSAFGDKGLSMLEQDEIEKIRSLLLGHRIERIADDHMRLDDGTVVRIVPNEGCGGCSNGYYELSDLNEVDNVVTAVDVVETVAETEDQWSEPERSYSVFVVAEDKRINLFAVHGNDGNGYYGTGYRLLIREPS